MTQAASWFDRARSATIPDGDRHHRRARRVTAGRSAVRRHEHPAGRGAGRGRRRRRRVVPASGPRCASRVGSGCTSSEAHGGAGYGLVEQAVVIEELGHACAPGPYVPTAIAAADPRRRGRPGRGAVAGPKLAAGEVTGAVAFSGARPGVGRARRRRDRLRDRRRLVRARRRRGAARKELPSIDLTPPRRRARPRRRRARRRTARLAGPHRGARARSRRGPAGGRSDRHRAVVRRDRGRVREGARAVRAADRPVPRREAPLRRHAGAHRARARGGVGRGAAPSTTPTTETGSQSRPPRRSPSTPRSSTARTACRRSAASASRGSTTRTSTCGARSRCTSSRERPTSGACAPRAKCKGAHAAGSRSTSGPKPRRTAPKCARSSTRSRISRPGNSASSLAADGYLTPGWPRPWGRDAKALELLVIEEEFRAAKVHARQHRRRRVGAADAHRVRHDRAAGAVDPADAARRDQLVPALQRAGRGIRPRRAHRRARRASKAVGCSTARRCGRRWPARRSGASASPAPRPIVRSTKASRASWST